MPAPVAGTLVRILVEADETVPVGTILGEISINGAGAGEARRDDDHRGDESGADMSDPGATEMHHVAAKTQAEQSAPSGELVDVVLPQMGESVQEGTVLEWHKQVGDQVAEGETLVEISTDKVDAEIPSPVAGVVAEILAEPDETVQSGTIVARIEPGAAAPKAVRPLERPQRRARGEARAPPATAPRTPPPSPFGSRTRTGSTSRGVEGSGRGGKVTKDDVLALVDGNGGAPPTAAPAAPAKTPPAGTTPLRGPAATLARFMNESRTIPTATSFRTLSVSILDARRKALKAAGQKLSFTHLIAWAIVQAARDMHVMTNAYAEADGKPQRVVPEGVSLGLAVDVERKDGSPLADRPGDPPGRPARLPVLRRPLRRARRRRARQHASAGRLHGREHHAHQPRRDRDGRLRAAADAGPGHDHRDRRDRAAAGLGAAPIPARLNELGVSKVMTMTSTYDHRVIQGAESGEFLRRIDALLQGEDGFYDTIFGALELTPPGPAKPADVAAKITAEDPVPAEVKPDVAGAPGRGPAPGRAGRHLGRQGAPDARPPRGAARPARHAAARRPGARPGDREPDARADAGDPRVDPARRGARRDVRRRAAAPAGHLLRHDRLRDRAHRRPQPARLAAPVGRVGRPPDRARPGPEARAAEAAVGGRGARELPAQGVPRQEAVLDRGRSTCWCR